jgi:hypothetical protein
MDQAVVAFLSSVVELIIGVGIGVFFLLYGHRFFWLIGGLALATIGLVVVALIVALIVVPANVDTTRGLTIDLPDELIQNSPAIIAALLCGVVSGAILGAVLLLRAPRVAAAIVGLVGGATLTVIVLSLYRIELPGWLSALLALAIGIVTAVLARRNPDTSLIVLSVLIGTNVIIRALRLDLNLSISAIIWLCLMLAGILFQTYTLRKRQAIRWMALSKVGRAPAVKR